MMTSAGVTCASSKLFSWMILKIWNSFFLKVWDHRVSTTLKFTDLNWKGVWHVMRLNSRIERFPGDTLCSSIYKVGSLTTTILHLRLINWAVVHPDLCHSSLVQRSKRTFRGSRGVRYWVVVSEVISRKAWFGRICRSDEACLGLKNYCAERCGLDTWKGQKAGRG